MPGPGLQFLAGPSDGPQPWTAAYRGIEYQGEVASGDTWDPRWGEPIGSDAFFRIVFLGSPAGGSALGIRDRRIAVCSPQRPLDWGSGPLGAEVQSIREVRAAYRTNTGGQLEVLRGALSEAEEQAQRRLADDAAQAFAAGTVVLSDETTLDASALYPGPVTDAWVDALAKQVLSRAYPALPIDGAEFPAPLTAEGVEGVFEALFSPHPTADQWEAMRRFGPGLRLVPPDFLDCPVLDSIRELMDAYDRALPAPVLLAHLTKETGLPKHLATLFILVYVARNTPAVELSLSSRHDLRARDGKPFLGDRITWDVLSMIQWSPVMAEGFAALQALQPPTWRATLPYAQQIAAEALSETDVEAEQQAALMARLQDLNATVRLLAEGLHAMSRALGAPLPAGVLGDMALVGAITSTTDYRGFYRACVERNASPLRLHEALVRLRDLQPLVDDRSRYHSTVRYLEGIPAAPTLGELLLAQETLLAQLAFDGLLETPSRWPALRSEAQRFIRQYVARYSAHHDDYHARMGLLWERLDRAAPGFETLERLNSLSALGPPVGLQVGDCRETLGQAVRPCALSGESLMLNDQPVCQACGLDTWGAPPEREVDDCLHRLKAALDQQMARLRERLVGLVLEESGTPPVERFLRVLRAADVDALPDALDHRVLEFLRTLLPAR